MGCSNSKGVDTPAKPTNNSVQQNNTNKSNATNQVNDTKSKATENAAKHSNGTSTNTKPKSDVGDNKATDTSSKDNSTQQDNVERPPQKLPKETTPAPAVDEVKQKTNDDIEEVVVKVQESSREAKTTSEEVANNANTTTSNNDETSATPANAAENTNASELSNGKSPEANAQEANANADATRGNNMNEEMNKALQTAALTIETAAKNVAESSTVVGEGLKKGLTGYSQWLIPEQQEITSPENKKLTATKSLPNVKRAPVVSPARQNSVLLGPMAFFKAVSEVMDKDKLAKDAKELENKPRKSLKESPITVIENAEDSTELVEL